MIASRPLLAEFCLCQLLLIYQCEQLGEDSLQQAAAEGAGASALRLLVAAGADPCGWTEDSKWCPVMLAAQYGHLEVSTNLLSINTYWKELYPHVQYNNFLDK